MSYSFCKDSVSLFGSETSVKMGMTEMVPATNGVILVHAHRPCFPVI